MSNSNMPPKNDSANNRKAAEKQAEEPTLNVLLEDSDVKCVLQYFKQRPLCPIPSTRQKFLNFCESNSKLREFTPAILEKIWTALEGLNLPQTTKVGKTTGTEKRYRRNLVVQDTDESALKSTGEQRDVNNQVEIEPNRKKPRLDLDREKKINENKCHSAPVSGYRWTYDSTQPRRANMISSRKDTPC